MNVTFYELPYCCAAGCSEQSWVDQEVERQQLGLPPPLPPPLQAQALVFCLHPLRGRKSGWGCTCVKAKSSAVMRGEVKNSTPAGQISTVLGP